MVHGNDFVQSTMLMTFVFVAFQAFWGLKTVFAIIRDDVNIPANDNVGSKALEPIVEALAEIRSRLDRLEEGNVGIVRKEKEEAKITTTTQLADVRNRLGRPEEGNGGIVTNEKEEATTTTQLDVFDPTMSLTDYNSQTHQLHASTSSLPPSQKLQLHHHLWRPSPAWIQSCTHHVARDSSLMKPFINKPSGCRLGDCIKFCRACKPGGPETIAAAYQAAGCKGKLINRKFRNLPIVETTLQNVATTQKGFHKPDPNDVVLHLRLGDGEFFKVCCGKFIGCFTSL